MLSAICVAVYFHLIMVSKFAASMVEGAAQGFDVVPNSCVLLLDVLL